MVYHNGESWWCQASSVALALLSMRRLKAEEAREVLWGSARGHQGGASVPKAPLGAGCPLLKDLMLVLYR